MSKSFKIFIAAAVMIAALTSCKSQFEALLNGSDVDAGATVGPWWEAPSGDTPGYLSSYAQYRYIGVPAIDGYALVRILAIGGNVELSSLNPKFCVTDSIAKSTTILSYIE